MLSRPQTCAGCVLHDNNLCTGFAPAFGKGSLGVLVIAESLGEHESREGRPLVPKAQAGSVFARALKRMALDENQFVIINTVNCRPQHNRLEGEWYEDAAIAHCSRYVEEAVRRFRPRAILTLGNVPMRSLTGLSGQGRTVSTLRGYCLPAASFTGGNGTPIPVIPSYHPSFISRGNEKYLGVLMHDIGKAIRIAQGKLIEGRDYIFDPFNDAELRGFYNTSPTESDIRDLLEEIASNPDRLIAYDIETDYTSKKGEDEYEIESNTRITQVQFSTKPRTGIALPWTNDTIPVIRQVLASQNPKAAHNGWRFDNPILKAAGVDIRGTNYDTMTMFHHLQPDLPADLQFAASFCNFPFPWKFYASSDLAFYGIADVDAVQHIMMRLPEDMKKRGVWDSYMEYVLSLQPILEGMQTRGIRIDLPARAEFKQEIETEKTRVNAELQLQVPSVVKPKQIYKEWPNEAKTFIDQIKQANAIVGPKGGKKLPVVKMGVATSAHHITLTDSQRGELLAILGDNWRFDNGSLHRVDDFLPNSTAHLKKLIVHYGEPIPKDLDDDETTSRPELEKLIEKLNAAAEKELKKRSANIALTEKKQLLAKLLTQSIEYRKLNKIVSTYIDGWRVDSEGRIHTTYTFAPATGQLSSKDPNVQNAPKHGKLAKTFRQCIVPSEGNLLMECDYKSFHALTLGFEACDPDYMRLARLDIHSYVACHLLKMPERDKLITMPDQEMLDYFKWLKSDPDRKFVRDKKAKPTCLGYGFGLGAKKLFDMNTDSFSNQKEAQAVIDMLNSLFPRTAKFRNDIRQKAHRQGFLLSRYGFIRWFWSVLRWDAKQGKEVSGEDSESAIAFLPANSAFGKIREAMLEIDQTQWGEYMVNTVHDSLIFDIPKPLLDQAAVEIRDIMQKPGKRLIDPIVAPNGLACEVEVSVGETWADLKEIKI